MDVLEHIADDKTALLEWVKNLKSTGKILITVPAFKALWSYHDEFLGHERRYTKKELLSVAKICGLRPVFINYSFSYLFPIVFLVRAFSSENNHNTDLILPHPIINKFLTIIGKLEAKLGGFALFGTSVIGIFELDHENSES
jgi:hypothetical protein